MIVCPCLTCEGDRIYQRPAYRLRYPGGEGWFSRNRSDTVQRPDPFRPGMMMALEHTTDDPERATIVGARDAALSVLIPEAVTADELTIVHATRCWPRPSANPTEVT